MTYPQDRETANDYQEYVVKYSKGYDIYGTPKALPVYSLGLAGETGEVCELLKRHFRGDDIPAPAFKEKLKLELGDVIAYVTLIAHTFDIRLDDILQANIHKAAKREAAKTQLGSGSDR